MCARVQSDSVNKKEKKKACKTSESRLDYDYRGNEPDFADVIDYLGHREGLPEKSMGWGRGRNKDKVISVSVFVMHRLPHAKSLIIYVCSR